MSKATLMRKIESEGAKTRKAINRIVEAIELHNVRMPNSERLLAETIADLVRAINAEDRK